MANDKVEEIALERYLPGQNQYFIEFNHIGVFFPPHLHAFYEIELVTSGEGYEEIDGETYEIKEGSITVMVPDEVHSYVCKNGEKLNITSIKVNPMFIFGELLMLNKSMHIKSLPEDDYSLIKSLCHKISECERNPDDYFAVKIVRDSVNLIFLTCLSLNRKNIREQSVAVESDRYRRALLYIHKNFRRSLTVADVAREVYLAPNYFSSFFEKNMGMSCSKYINKLRLELAYEYITTTDMTLKEIYISCGYKSFSYFSNVFKNRYGHSPGYFRKSK